MYACMMLIYRTFEKYINSLIECSLINNQAPMSVHASRSAKYESIIASSPCQLTLCELTVRKQVKGEDCFAPITAHAQKGRARVRRSCILLHVPSTVTYSCPRTTVAVMDGLCSSPSRRSHLALPPSTASEETFTYITCEGTGRTLARYNIAATVRDENVLLLLTFSHAFLCKWSVPDRPCPPRRRY